MSASRLFALLLCGAALLSADQLTLKNGDRVTGKLVKKDGDAVVFKSDLFGEITLKWPDITNLTTDQPLTVELANRTVTGNVTANNGTIVVETNTIPQTEVRAVRNAAEQAKFERMAHPRWTELWAGFFDFGVAASSGNSSTSSFTTAFNATRASRTDAIRLNFTEIYATGRVNGVKQTTADAARGGWSYDRNTHPKVFLNVFNNYEYDSFQHLDFRFTGGGGGGYHAIKREAEQLDLLAGVDFNHETFSGVPTSPTAFTPGTTRNYGEIYYGDDFNYKLFGRSSLKQSFRMFDNMSDFGQYRLAFDLGADTKIKKFLSWQVTFSDRYLSNPPVGLRRNDLLLSTGVRLTFAR